MHGFIVTNFAQCFFKSSEIFLLRPYNYNYYNIASRTVQSNSVYVLSVLHLTNKEASTVLCSVVKHVGSG